MATEETRSGANGGGCPVTGIGQEFDAFVPDPYAWYTRAREEEPVFYYPKIDYWVVTRDGDVREAMMNAENFSAEIALQLYYTMCPSAAKIIEEHGVKISPSVVDEEAPVHGPHRKALRKSFTPTKVKEMDPLVRDLVTKQIDTFVKQGEADLVTDFMFQVPADVIMKLFGVPDEELDTVRQYAKRNAEFGFGYPSEEEQVELSRNMADYWEYARGHVDRLLEAIEAGEPGDDVISVFAQGLKEQGIFDCEYCYIIMLQILFAGHETTVNGSAGMFRSLLQHRDQWEAVCADPELIPNAVEESLRYAPPVPHWRRLAKEPATLSGVEVPEGTKLLVALGSANRDESRFENSETFDIRRPNAKEHVAFGHGRHLCVGAPLARLEMNIALEELTRRLPHIEFVEGQLLEMSPNTSHCGPEHVLVSWDPAKNPVPEDRP